MSKYIISMNYLSILQLYFQIQNSDDFNTTNQSFQRDLIKLKTQVNNLENKLNITLNSKSNLNEIFLDQSLRIPEHIKQTISLECKQTYHQNLYQLRDLKSMNHNQSQNFQLISYCYNFDNQLQKNFQDKLTNSNIQVIMTNVGTLEKLIITGLKIQEKIVKIKNIEDQTIIFSNQSIYIQKIKFLIKTSENNNDNNMIDNKSKNKSGFKSKEKIEDSSKIENDFASPKIEFVREIRIDLDQLSKYKILDESTINDTIDENYSNKIPMQLKTFVEKEDQSININVTQEDNSLKLNLTIVDGNMYKIQVRRNSQEVKQINLFTYPIFSKDKQFTIKKILRQESNKLSLILQGPNSDQFYNGTFSAKNLSTSVLCPITDINFDQFYLYNPEFNGYLYFGNKQGDIYVYTIRKDEKKCQFSQKANLHQARKVLQANNNYTPLENESAQEEFYEIIQINKQIIVISNIFIYRIDTSLNNLTQTNLLKISPSLNLEVKSYQSKQSRNEFMATLTKSASSSQTHMVLSGKQEVLQRTDSTESSTLEWARSLNKVPWFLVVIVVAVVYMLYKNRTQASGEDSELADKLKKQGISAADLKKMEQEDKAKPPKSKCPMGQPNTKMTEDEDDVDY